MDVGNYARVIGEVPGFAGCDHWNSTSSQDESSLVITCRQFVTNSGRIGFSYGTSLPGELIRQSICGRLFAVSILGTGSDLPFSVHQELPVDRSYVVRFPPALTLRRNYAGPDAGL
jgi:hypothetical protein